MITDAQESCGAVFYALMRKKYFTTKDPEFALLHQSDRLRHELDTMARDFDCHIGWFAHAAYLLPNSGNEYLGYSNADMRAKFGSGEKAAILYLRYFIMLIILLKFYDTKTAGRASQSFLSLDELILEVHRRLKEASEQESKDETSKNTFTTLLKAFETLSGEDNNRQTSKKGLFRKVLLFLRDQNLISWDDHENTLRPLTMLDDKVTILLRNDTFDDLFAALRKGDSNAGTE